MSAPPLVPVSRLLTVSRMKEARLCQRAHHYRYGLGYRPRRQSEELRFGDLVHRGLEQWWLAGADPEARITNALAAVACEDPFEQVRAEEMILGYDARWGDEPLEAIFVECQFVGPVVNPTTGAHSKTWRLAGKLDVLARNTQTGHVHIIEHKTSAEDISTGSAYWKRLRLDAQVSVYFDGADMLGHPAESCIYDVLAKPGLRPKKATSAEARKYKADGTLYANQRDTDESVDEYRARVREAIAAAPDDYFARGEIVRLEDERADALHDVWDIGRQLREAELAGRYPRNPEACIRFGRSCSFFGVCCREEQIDDPALFEKLENVHPELQPQPTPF